MATVLFVVAAATSHSHPVWFSCQSTDTSTCHSYVMPRHKKQRATGFWDSCTKVKKTCAIYPKFKKPHIRAAFRQVTRAVRSVVGCYRVTGYYPGGITADGSAAVPGVIANNWLPFNTRVSIPALGIVGYVHDRIGFGTQFDVVSTNPFALTGCYKVVIG